VAEKEALNLFWGVVIKREQNRRRKKEHFTLEKKKKKGQSVDAECWILEMEEKKNPWYWEMKKKKKGGLLKILQNPKNFPSEKAQSLLVKKQKNKVAHPEGRSLSGNL